MIELNDDSLIWIALGRVKHIGPVLIKRLLEKFGSPNGVFAARESELRSVDDVGPKVAKSILGGPDLEFASEQLEICCKKKFNLVSINCPEYPSMLKHIYDPPHLLYVRGELSDSDKPAVAVVGSRAASHYGKRMAEQVAYGLASSGVTVVSGMARGIDSIAHKAALETSGRTIAVLGCGLDIVYPPENTTLYRDIPDHGAVITELPCGTPPDGPNFPRRNRIISGLSLGVVIVEAGKKSGALLTARHALDQNREVFAVPGNTTSITSSGTNSLIKQGARLVTSADDVLSELEFLLPGERRAVEPLRVSMNSRQIQVFEVMGDEPLHVDQLARMTSIGVPELLGILLDMELKAAVRQVPGKKFVKLNITPYNG
jgi:DNA processing protein